MYKCGKAQTPGAAAVPSPSCEVSAGRREWWIQRYSVLADVTRESCGAGATLVQPYGVAPRRTIARLAGKLAHQLAAHHPDVETIAAVQRYRFVFTTPCAGLLRTASGMTGRAPRGALALVRLSLQYDSETSLPCRHPGRPWLSALHPVGKAGLGSAARPDLEQE